MNTPAATTTNAPQRGATSTVVLVGFLMLIPMAYGGYVLLPLADGIPVGVLAWIAVGGVAAFLRATLIASIGGAVAGLAFALFAYAGLSRLFTNTPWYLTPDRFALEFGLTVVIAMAAVAVGHVLVSFLRRRSPFAAATRRDFVRVFAIALLVVGGGTLFVERIQAVIPLGAIQPSVVVAHDNIQLSRSSAVTGPMYWTFDNVDLPDREVGILAISTDEEMALRKTGEMGGTYESGSRVLGWSSLWEAGRQTVIRSDLPPGRYLLLVVEPLPSGAEQNEDADRSVVIDLEFEVTD